jgi:hypothetical protein
MDGLAGLDLTARRAAPGRIEIDFTLRADLRRVEIPRPRPPVRADGLWRHTCFEVFASRGGPDYREYNFAPSGAWAAYQFTGYRAGMSPLAEASSQALWRTGDDSLALSVILESEWFAGDSPGGAVRLGCSAVIESASGGLSYWALRHPSEKPDFHDAGGFVVELL